MLLAAALAAAVAALVAAAFAMRGSRRAHAALRETTARLARIDSVVPAHEPVDSYGAEALQRDNRVRLEARDGDRDLALLAQFLADYRDVAGAEEAIFWRWSAERDALTPVAWSSEGPRPTHFDVAEWGPLVQWSAETGVVQTVGQDETVFVGASCVRHEDELLGVLSLTHHAGLGLQRTALKEWLPRLAVQLASFHELMGMRRRYAGHLRQSQALLDAVQRLQGDRSGEGLVRSLCETALDVSGARGAALVRWDADSETGELHYATEGTGLRSHSPLDPASVVATVCRAGRLHVLEDARGAASGQSLYGVSRVIREPGSVAIVPITREGRSVGALVLEADDPGALTQEEARPLTILGAVVSGSLELAWSFAEVDRRARTDPLTGLFNRLHFGEQLQRMLNEADRDKHGQPLSLMVMDIDHFKGVNDSWGHEVGDAVLRHVARIIQEGVRTVDVCVRYGGEEIAVLMGQTTSDAAVEVAERLRARIAETPLRQGGATIAVTASFGVAAYPETVKVRDQLFPSADKALYIAKHEGRNCVRAKPASKGRTAS
jgi:diguanylate cyclase (GGDEF)-like protein